MRGDLLGRRRALQRQQPPPVHRQGQAPGRESIQRRDRPGGDHLGGRQLSDQLLGAAAGHRHLSGQAQGVHDLGQEGGPPGQRLDQHNGQIGAGDRERDPRQSRPGTDVDDRGIIGNDFH